MAYAHVQSETFGLASGISRTLTPASGFTTGSRVFAGLLYFQNSGDPARTIVSVTDQSSNAISYSEESVTQRYATDTGMLVFNIRSMPAGVTALIITMSGAPAYGSNGFISEFTGLSTGAADAVNSNSASAGTGTDAVVSGTATRGASAALTWGVAADSVFNSTPNAGTGFTSGAGANALRVEYATASSGSNQATFTNTHGSACNHIAYIFVVAEASAGSEVTKSPATAVVTMGGLAPTTNAFTYVAIQDMLINESGQAVANAANIRLMVWYGGQAIGAPDYSVNGLISDATGSISWSVPPGTLTNGQAIFYVAQDSISYSNYTCGRVVPTYG